MEIDQQPTLRGKIMANENNFTPEQATKIVKLRDALIAEDFGEAWHQLYALVCPDFASHTPWMEIERLASESEEAPDL